MQKLILLGSSIARTSGFLNTAVKATTTKLGGFSMRGLCSSSQFIFDVESVEDFSEKVLNSPVPVIADFHAEWCGPCQALGPRLEEKVNGQNGSILLARINVDYAGELATDYGISAVPTVIAFKNGERIGGFSGVLDDEQLDEFIENSIDS